eukprot:1138860-Rhodomonas_salina.1
MRAVQSASSGRDGTRIQKDALEPGDSTCLYDDIVDPDYPRSICGSALHNVGNVHLPSASALCGRILDVHRCGHLPSRCLALVGRKYQRPPFLRVLTGSQRVKAGLHARAG